MISRSAALAVIAVLFGACASEPAVDIEAEHAALSEAARAYGEAGRSGNVDQLAALYASNATMMPPDAETVSGPANVREYIEGFMTLDDFQLVSDLETVVVSPAGQMGFTVATVNLTWTENGNPLSQHLRDVHVWVKQPDGSWRIVMDVWNSLQPETE